MSRSKRLTVLQVVPRMDAGGAERTTVEIARAVVKAGGRALVATAGGRLNHDVRLAGGEIVPMPVDTKDPVRIWLNARVLARLIRKEKVDIVHARSRACGWSAWLAAKRTKTPFVATYHGIYSSGNVLKRRYNAVMVKGALTIANSQFTAKHVIEEHGLDPARIVMIPRGFDVSAYDPAAMTPERLAAARRAFGLRGDEFAILLPGRMTRLKGHMVAVDALKRLREMRPALDAVLVCVGEAAGRDEYVAEVERFIASARLKNAVKLPGHWRDMPAAYAVATVALSASTQAESFGRIMIEAQAMQRPIVATAHGGALETVRDHDTGFLVPPNDAEALAKAFATLDDMGPDERDAMGARGRAYVSANFTVEAMCAATLGVYDRLLAIHGRT